VPHQRFVLDQQHGFPAADLALRCLALQGAGLGRGKGGEQQGDGRALARLRAQLNLAAGLGDEAVDLAEPQAGALAPVPWW
jgi:hypothetical protein